MGIRGLLKLLERSRYDWHPRSMTVDEVKSQNRQTIVIDGCSMMPRLCFKEAMYGGCLKIMQKETNRLVRNFRDVGFEPIVFVYGGLDQAKIPKWLSNRLVELEDMKNYSQYLDQVNGGEKVEFAKASIGSLKSIVAELFTNAKCKVVMSVVEADKEAASFCLKNNCFGVVSEDSDYIAHGVFCLIKSDSVRFKIEDDKATAISFKFQKTPGVCNKLGLEKEFFPLLGSLTSNDYVQSLSEGFYTTILRLYPPKRSRGYSGQVPQGIFRLTRVLEYLKDECRKGNLQKDKIRDWVARNPYLTEGDKIAVNMSLEGYVLKDRDNWILAKGGEYCRYCIQNWEHYQSEYRISLEKNLVQIICNHSFFESPCVELGMSISVWQITKRMRHNLYELLLLPIRDTNPTISECSVSPLKTGSTSARNPVLYTPNFAFVDKHKIQCNHPGEPLNFDNPRFALEVFLDSCGITDVTIRDYMQRSAEGSQGHLMSIGIAEMIAHIVGKWMVFPSYCQHALVYTCSFIVDQKFVLPDDIRDTIPISMMHVNAATTFCRVFDLVKALDVACCCPVKNISRVRFYDGRLFHYICNLLASGDMARVEAIGGGCYSFSRVRKFCETHLTYECAIHRIHETVEDCSGPVVEEDDISVDDNDYEPFEYIHPKRDFPGFTFKKYLFRRSGRFHETASEVNSPSELGMFLPERSRSTSTSRSSSPSRASSTALEDDEQENSKREKSETAEERRGRDERKRRGLQRTQSETPENRRESSCRPFKNRPRGTQRRSGATEEGWFDPNTPRQRRRSMSIRSQSSNPKTEAKDKKK